MHEVAGGTATDTASNRQQADMTSLVEPVSWTARAENRERLIAHLAVQKTVAVCKPSHAHAVLSRIHPTASLCTASLD